MCQGNFSGLWIASATYQCNIADGMMRRAERPTRNKSGMFRKFSGNRMYLGCFQGFL